MNRIAFDYARPVVDSDPARNDVACFVGLARATGAALPPAMQNWLQSRGWTEGPLARPTLAPFTDLPLPVESYAAFTSLFDAGGSAGSFGTDYLAAAVRSFFAQGGRRCYVVRMGDPVSPEDDGAQTATGGKAVKLASLLPDQTYSAFDRRSWHGAGHLGGLPDVAFLALPDLPVLCASQAIAAGGVVAETPPGPARFAYCEEAAPEPLPPPTFVLPAPRLTPEDYVTWSGSLQRILDYLQQNNLCHTQLIAALPLPQDLNAAAAAENPASELLAQDIRDVIAEQLPEIPGSRLSRAQLQLAYPWLVTGGSAALNESLEPPDGALAGILARNALTRGAFHDATKIVPAGISDIWPYLPPRELKTPSTAPSWGGSSPKPLITRLSLFGFTPAGLRLLSDVTAYPGEQYRSARIPRLVRVISRAAQHLGERVVFRQNGPRLWKNVENSLARLLTELWRANALDGATARDAFTVRCDRSSMTQSDIDNGRLIAVASFVPAATIELIRVTLAIETSGATAQGIEVMAEAS